ncbi:MAG: hypothetical protein PHC28_15825 [Flavobacterium sp.]|uniref:hypothetical protein n=1 Tax=Flavobacterium sp. TaxID=239 RepID=UPI002624DE9C|nr:hypothetical protein [Flavobacterium sp.]MDD5151922.1 hypothetical protein [Flavobacterium sp.]
MFFHISRSDIGEEVILTPRLPPSAIISQEGNIPRICVSPNPLYAIRSITGTKKPRVYDILSEFKDNIVGTKKLTIYGTLKEAYIPPSSSDFRFNSEHWFLTDTKFYKLGYIDIIGLLNGNLFILEEYTKFNTQWFDNDKDQYIKFKIDIKYKKELDKLNEKLKVIVNNSI